MSLRIWSIGCSPIGWWGAMNAPNFNRAMACLSNLIAHGDPIVARTGAEQAILSPSPPVSGLMAPAN